MNILWIVLLLSLTSSASSSCTFSDILSNNTDCLPSSKEDGTFISLSPFELQMQIDADVNDGDNISEGIRYALEYYLNYTLTQFDNDAEFDDGGFAYATVESVELIEPVAQQQPVKWRFEVTAGAYYSLSPGGWVFSSVPTESEVLGRVKNVIEEPLDDGQEGQKFTKILEKLLYEDAGIDALQDVAGIGLVVVAPDAASSSLRPTVQSTTLEPTELYLTSVPTSHSDTLSPSQKPVIITDEPSRHPSTSSPGPQPTIILVAETSMPTVQLTPEQSQMVPTPWPTDDLNGTTASPSIILFDNDSTTEASSNNTTQNQTIKKAILDPTTSTDNRSTIIASATLASSLLILVAVSAAYFISRRDPRSKYSVRDKDCPPLHTLSDDDWNGDLSDIEMAITSTLNSSNQERKESLNETANSSKDFDVLVNERQHSPLSPPIETNPNDNSTLSTSTDKSYDPAFLIGQYDEEKRAKKEMARELFATKEESFGFDFSSNNDVGLPAGPSEHSAAADDKVQENNSLDADSTQSLDCSKSDAQSSCDVHPVRIINIISPTSLQERRSSGNLRVSNRAVHPTDNDVTVVTDDDSNIDDNASAGFPELNSCWNEGMSSMDVDCPNSNTWKRCFADCAPTSLKDLVSPMRHEDECDEVNEILAKDDDRWLNDAICGRSEWDFRDANNESKLDSTQEFVVMPR